MNEQAQQESEVQVAQRRSSDSGFGLDGAIGKSNIWFKISIQVGSRIKQVCVFCLCKFSISKVVE